MARRGEKGVGGREFESGGGDRKAVNGGGQGEVEGEVNERSMVIKSDDDADAAADAAWLVNGGGAEVATRTASPGISCSPDSFSASTRVLSRYLRRLVRPSYPVESTCGGWCLTKKMEEDICRA
jgi:hypothetical protein